MRWTSDFVGVLLFSFRAGDLVAKSGASAESSAGPPHSFVPGRIEALAYPLSRSSRPPLADEALIGSLGAACDAHLLVPQFLDAIGMCRSTPVALLLRSPRLQFHAADLVRGQGRPRPEVVDVLRQQMPAQDRELARQGDGGDLVPALRPDPDEEGGSGPGAVAAAHAAPTSIARAWLRPTLLMRP